MACSFKIYFKILVSAPRGYGGTKRETGHLSSASYHAFPSTRLRASSSAPGSKPPASVASMTTRLRARLTARRPQGPRSKIAALKGRAFLFQQPLALFSSQDFADATTACHDSLPIALPAPPSPRASLHQRLASASSRRTTRATAARLGPVGH